ncbi:hypothetical protein BDV19DRAFT_388546 [Aspergillus venezuelensis]
MLSFNVPNWLGVLLTLLTILSFIPQLYKIRTQKSSAGLSLYYILINTICATEHFTTFFYILTNDTMDPGPNRLVHKPPTTGDWIT